MAIVVAFLLTLCAHVQALAKGASDCKLMSFGEVSLTVTPDSVTFPVTVNGKNARMALNLGSAFSVFWEDAASELSLRVRPYTSYWTSIGDYRVTRTALFDSLTLGQMRVRKRAFLLASPDADWARRDVAGFLGMDFFQAVDLELDLAHGKMRLFSQKHCRGIGAYWAQHYAAMPLFRGDAGEWWVPVELEERRIAAALSSGHAVTTLSGEVAKKLFGFDEKSPGVQLTKDGSGHPYHYRAMKMTAPGSK